MTTISKKNGLLILFLMLVLGLSSGGYAEYFWEQEKPKKSNLQLEYALKAAQDRIESLTLKVESLMIELEVYNLKIKSVEEDAKSEALVLKKKNNQLNDEIEALKLDNKKLAAVRNSTDEEIQNFINTIDHIKEEKLDLLKKVDLLQSIIKQKEGHIELHQKNILSLQNNLNQLNIESKATELEQAKLKIKLISKQLSEQKSQILVLSKKSTIKPDEHKKLVEKIAKLTKQLKNQIRFSQRFKRQINSMQQDTQLWQDKLDESENALNNVKKELEIVKQSKLKEASDLVNAKQKLQDSDSVLRLYQEKDKNHQFELEILRNKIARKENLLQETKDILEIKSLKLDDFNIVKSSTNDEIKSLKSSNLENKATIIQLKSILTKNKKKVRQQERVFNVRYLRMCSQFNDIASPSQQVDCTRIFK